MKPSPTNFLVFSAAGLMLAGAIWLQFTKAPKADTIEIPDLQKILGAQPIGWETRDLPIGDTEGVREAAEKTLRYDAYFFREYRRGSLQFTVFVAYWAPGKHPPQMITQHTPDRCWTMNGMTCEEMRFNVPRRIGETSLWPAQWRKFLAPNGGVTYTMFWHMVGDRPYDFGQRFYDIPSPVTFLSEAMRFAAGAAQEQRFFRITSNVPPEQIWDDPGVQLAMIGFLRLRLGQAR